MEKPRAMQNDSMGGEMLWPAAVSRSANAESADALSNGAVAAPSNGAVAGRATTKCMLSTDSLQTACNN